MTNRKTHILFWLAGFTLVVVLCSSRLQQSNWDQRIISHTVSSNAFHLKFYWMDRNGQRFQNFQRLRQWLNGKGEELVFAMNGGMYTKEGKPQGLYIEKDIMYSKLDTNMEGYGNFYMQPNGVFYLTNDYVPNVVTTERLKHLYGIKYATQSGPMLIIDGELHPRFRQGSKNVHIRNGVGILPNGDILFAMSREKINFYDFATFFKEKGCQNALYLDGFVSRLYLPEQDWEQLDGNFGVIIAETKKSK